MSGPSWTDIVGVVGGSVGILVALPSLYFARRAANAGVDSATAAREAAEAARRSADEAAALTQIERERRKDEREQRHEELGPDSPGAIVAELREGRATKSLFGSIHVPNNYRVRAAAIFHGGGETELGIPLIIHANERVDLHIEQWPPGSTQPKTQAIKFQFWPPLKGDGVDVWTCPCGRPVDESIGAPGHWEWVVPVVWEQPKKNRVLGL
jgi:hypothetical protein